MMKNIKGFGAHGLLLVLAVAGLVGFSGWYVWDRNSNDNNATPQSQTAQDYSYSDITVPSDWKKYTNEKYGISFSYPDTHKASGTKLNPDDGADKAEFTAQAVGKGGGYDVRVLNTNLVNVVEEYKADLKDRNQKLLGVESVTKNGFQGTKVTSTDGDVTTAEFYFSVRDKVYSFMSVYEKDTMRPANVKESEAIYNSLVLQ